MGIPTPDQANQPNHESPGYLALMASIERWFRDTYPMIRALHGEWSSGGDVFYHSTWPNRADILLGMETLRDKGWEAKIEIGGGRDPAVTWEVRPLESRAPVTPPPVGRPPVLRMRTIIHQPEELLPEAREWLILARDLLMSGTLGPDVNENTGHITGMRPPGRDVRDPVVVQVHRVLMDAGWSSALLADPPIIWREKTTSFRRIPSQRFFVFPTPDEVNEAIYTARGRAALAAGSGNTAFPSPDDGNETLALKDAAARAKADEYLNKLAVAIRDGQLRPDSSGWAYVRNPSLPTSFEKGTTQWQRLIDTVGQAGWEADIWRGSSRDGDHTLMLRRR